MFWDRVAGIYDLFGNVYNGKVDRELCRVVASQIGPGDSVLECACGTGMISVHIAWKCRHLIATDWVVVVPVHGGSFFMVKQWRHGMEALSVEFPAGVCEPGEDPAVTASRELREETGCLAGKLTLLCTCNPNPALFKNRLSVFLAEDLTPTGRQELDADEYINAFEVPMEDLMQNFGTGQYQHAYTGMALGMYLRHRLTNGKPVC